MPSSETKAATPTSKAFATKANRNRVQPWKSFANPKLAEHQAGIEAAPEQRYVGIGEHLAPNYDQENGG